MVSTIEETNASAVVVASPAFASVRGRWTRLAHGLPGLPRAVRVPLILIALFANWIPPYDPTEPIPGAKIFEPPFWMEGGSDKALLGTDFQARDIAQKRA